MAEIPLPIKMPVINTVKLFFRRQAKRLIRANTARAPVIEAVTIPNEARNPPAMPPANKTIATPSPEPALIPKIYGPAKGLANNVWSSRPATGKEMPVRTAVIARGSLICVRI